MMKMSMLAASAIAAALVANAPAAAQMNSGAMSGKSMASDKGMKMSAADMKMMKSCQRMSHDRMMKNKKCMEMMRMHPDMMKDGTMTKKGG